MIAAFHVSVASAGNPDDYLIPGRAAMLNGSLSGLRQAYEIFDNGVKDPSCANSRELKFLHALTGTAMLFIDNQNPAVKDSFFKLAEVFGVTVVGDIFDELEINALDENGCYKVPAGAPDVEDIPGYAADIIDNSIVPKIDAIVAELNSINEDTSLFRMFFTPAETGLENDLEVDYGDLLVLKGMLYAFKGLLQVETAYDIYLNLDWDLLQDLLYEQGIYPDTEITDAQMLDFLNIAVTDPNKISINTHFLNRYPNLLKLLPTSGHPEDGAAILAQARQSLIDGINYYFDALDYIKSEEDEQEDDLLYLDPNAAFLVNDVNEKLIALRDSLVNDTIITCPIETLRTYSVSGSGATGALMLEPDYGGLAPFYGGEHGSLTFLTGAAPSPWDVGWFQVGPDQIEVEVERQGGWQWTEGYFEATLSEDGSSFSDGTFEWWGYETGSLSGLSGAFYSSEVTDVNINLNPIFGSSEPVSPRDLLPQFGSDNVPIAGTFGHGLGNDATLGGILPDMTQGDWALIFDLDVTDLAAEFGTITVPDPATGGDTGTVKVIVTNEGENRAKGTVNIAVYLSVDEELDLDEDTLLTTLSNQSIDLAVSDPPKSKTFTISVNIPASLPPRNYYFLAYVSSSNIPDDEEENNLAVSDDTVDVEQPDLVPGADITDTFTEPAAAGDSGKVTVIVKNDGPVRAKGTIDIAIYVSTDDELDGADTLLTTTLNRTIDLDPQETATFTLNVTLPGGLDAGDYYFLADIDSGDDIGEIDEDNNLAVSDDGDLLTVVSPDLVGTITHTFKEPAAAGDKAKVRVVVTNQGSVPAKAKINIDVYASTDQALDGGDRLVATSVNRSINLKAGKSVTFSISVTLPADLTPGDYYFLADVDSTNAISESDEDNNLAVSTDTLTVERPDLVCAITHTFKEPAAAGDAAKARVVVTNQGNVLAKGKINIAVYLSTDQLLDGDDTLLTAVLNRPINLKPDKFVTLQISVTLPAGLTPGDYYFLADVDSGDAIPESDETNNLAATTDTLTVERPDLVSQQVSHTFKSPAPVGKKGTVKVIVKNQGNVVAKGKIGIDVYASTDQILGGDVLVGSKTNLPINLKKDKTKTVNISVALTGLAPGDYYFLADIDSANAIAESDETNNLAATTDPLKVQ
jgi:subtilase family serine protease